MQIPQNVISMLSAKGKGYVEAALKLAEGQKMIDEATVEIAALDGKKLGKKLNAGGAIVTPAVRALAKAKPTAERFKAALKSGPLSTGEIAKRCGSSPHTVREKLEAAGIATVGAGNQIKWTLTPPKSSIARKKPLANKVSRASKTARDQSKSKPANMATERADQDKIVALLKETPGLTIGDLMSKLKRSFYPVERSIKALIHDKRLKPATTKAKNGRPLKSWEPVVHGA